MNKGQKIIKGICDYTVLILYGAIVLYLFYIAGFSTAVITKTQKTYIIADSFWLNLLAAAIVVAGVVLLKKYARVFRDFIDRVNEDRAYSDRCRRAGLWIIGILSLFTVLILQNEPLWDQASIYRVADLWIDNNPAAMLKGEYMDVFANNNGIILIIYLLSLVFGSYNYLVLRLINVLCLVWLYRNMADIADLTGRRRIEGLVIIITGVLFLPAIIYTDYCYSIIIGLALIMASFRRMMMYINAGNEKRLRDLLLCSLFAFMALISKSNYMIFVIAMAIYGIYCIISRFDWKTLALSVILILSVFLSGTCVNLCVKVVTGITPSPGISYLSWIAMGMQDSDTKYYGWYNSYNWDSAEAVDYDREAHAAVCRDYISGRLREFSEDPGLALEFYAGKNSSQWNNPDFQAFWSAAYKGDRVEPSRLTNFLLSPRGTDMMNSALNVLQFLILTGAVLYVLLCRKRDSSFIFFGAVVIGGFIFHTFWEAKAQYTLPYFMMLIPVAASGLAEVTGHLSSKPSSRKEWFGLIPVAAVICGAIIIQLPVPVFSTIFKRNADAPMYMQYLSGSDTSYVRLPDGDYTITTSGDMPYGFQRMNMNMPKAAEERIFINNTNAASAQIYEIAFSSADDHMYVRFKDTNKALGIVGDAGDKTLVQALKMNGLPNQQWMLRQSSDGSSYNIIFSDTWALQYDTESRAVFLAAFDDSTAQRWQIRPCG
ncbi:hypothetical protein SAMN02910456_00670 [Ruminococcaceae bacterium YRB3002]|nr:hypothetical protein SAMN02910456_00670 [Ruminococcaceae bacterium YRB3002]